MLQLLCSCGISRTLLLLTPKAALNLFSFASPSLSAGNRVMCFNCNSFQDDRCGDTFNWTNQPAKKPCAGCCVKMVQGIGTGEDEDEMY